MDLKVGDEVLVRVKIAFIKNDMVGVHYPGKIHENWVAVAIPKSDIISVEQKWCEHIKDALGNCIKCGLLIKEQRCECKETIKQSGDNRCQYCGLPIRRSYWSAL